MLMLLSKTTEVVLEKFSSILHLHFTNELEVGCLGQDLWDLGLDGGDDQHAADGDHHSVLTDK